MQVQKTLVVFAIEQALLDIGGDNLRDKVSEEIFLKYDHSIEDCYENPEHMKYILNKIFGKSNDNIIDAIIKNLDEFAQIKKITRFLSNIK